MQMELPEAIELFVIARRIEALGSRTVCWCRCLLAHFAECVGNGEGSRLSCSSPNKGLEQDPQRNEPRNQSWAR
jgi:hypothetical protein